MPWDDDPSGALAVKMKQQSHYSRKRTKYFELNLNTFSYYYQFLGTGECRVMQTFRLVELIFQTSNSNAIITR